MTKETSTGLDPNAAFQNFFQDPEWKLKAGVGSILTAVTLILLTSGKYFLACLPLTLVVWSAVQGYILRTMRYAIKDPSGGLPPWNEWIDLFISGLTWLAILCSQLVVLLAVLVISLAYGNVHHYLDSLASGFTCWAYLTVFSMSMVAIIVSFFFPLLAANFAEQERISAAFAAKEAVRRLANRPLDFLVAWLLSLGIYWLSAIVPLITVIGVFLIPLTTFIAHTVNALMLAQVWRDAKHTARYDNLSF